MYQLPFIAWIFWNPQREAFTLPYFDLAIMWYGVLFAAGFIAGYFIFIPIVKQFIRHNRPEITEKNAGTVALAFTDRILWFIIIGTIIGARLGHVFFYDWPYYQAHPMEILMIRHGGLSSHGGTLGVLIGVFLFQYFNRKQFQISLIRLIDLLCIPTAFAVSFIRIGNFFNQEIVGTETTVPWAVIFGHPAEGGPAVPRHPAQLYEAVAYLATFAFLYLLWKNMPDP